MPDQLRTVDLTPVERHPPIVGTTARPSAAGPQPTAPADGGAAGSAPAVRLEWRGEDDTRAFAAQLATHPAIAGAFIELHGDLGAGKTTFARHLLRALGVRERVKSPTYTVVEPHEAGPLQIWHFDFFRFNDPHEWEDAGFRDIFAGPGLKLAEWPEKAMGLLPRADLVVHIEAQADESRRVTLLAQTPLGRELMT